MNRGKHRAKPADRVGTTSHAAEPDSEFAKHSAWAILPKVSELGSYSLRADMIGELASVASTWIVFEPIRGNGAGISLPSIRAVSIRRCGRRTFGRRGGVRGDVYVVSMTTWWLLALRTDPNRHDSIADATNSLIEHKN